MNGINKIINNSPHVRCEKHGICRMNCVSECNTVELIKHKITVKPPNSIRSDRNYRCVRCCELWHPEQISSTYGDFEMGFGWICEGCESVL